MDDIMNIDTLGASFLGNILTGKGTIRTSESTVRVIKKNLNLMDRQICNIYKIKDGANVINLDEFKSIETHWIALYVSGNNGRGSYYAIYFDGLEVKHIPKEIIKLIGNRNIITNIYGVHVYDLMWTFVLDLFVLW